MDFANKLLSHIYDPLKWSIADRCFSFSIVIILVQAIYLFWALYFIQHPDIAPWLDHTYLQQALVYQFVYISIWASLMMLFLRYKYKAPDSLWLSHLFVQSYFIGMVFFANILGFFTSGFLASVGLSGTLICLIIFQRHVVSWGLVSFFSIVVGATFLEQLDYIRYGPVYTSVPFLDGQLSGWFLISHAFSAFVIFLVGVFCSYHMIAKLHEQEVKINKANKFISRYISRQLSKYIFDENYEQLDTLSRRKLTIFFSDIVGFTMISEKLEPEDLSALLNEYLLEMTAIANEYGATIDKFVGDAIMIFFGAPNFTSDKDHATRAVFMAIDMQNRLESLRNEWLKKGGAETFSIRIGINTGQASVGNFGSEGRMDYTAIGRQVNLASRLESNCEPDKILVSHSTQALINMNICCQPNGEIDIKGVREPVRVYQIDPKSYAVEHELTV